MNLFHLQKKLIIVNFHLYIVQNVIFIVEMLKKFSSFSNYLNLEDQFKYLVFLIQIQNYFHWLFVNNIILFHFKLLVIKL